MVWTFLLSAWNCQQSKQAWSVCFQRNTFLCSPCFVFPRRFSQLLPAVILNWRVCLPTEAFVWRSFLLTGTHELCQQCWLSVISRLISATFNAKAIKRSTCRAEEWSFQQANKYPVILYSFSLFVLVRLHKSLCKQDQSQFGGLSTLARAKDNILQGLN